MDRFMTYEGEQPIWLDDFNFMQDAVKDTIRMIVNTIKRDGDEHACILQGCEITYTEDTAGHYKVAWTNGVALLDGEVLPVQGGSTEITIEPSGELYLYLHDVDTYDPKGDRTFKNGEMRSCYRRRHVTINGESENGYYINEIPRLEDYLMEKESNIYESDESAKINVSIIRKLGGSYDVKGIFNVKSITGIRTSVIIPSTDIEHLGYDNIPIGTTLGTLTYVKTLGDKSFNFPIIITVSRNSDNKISIKIDLTQVTSFAMGNGQFYCRLFSSSK